MGFLKDLKREWMKFWNPSYITDYILSASMGLATLVLFQFIEPHQQEFIINDPNLSYHIHEETITASNSAILSILPPVVVFAVTQNWYRSWHDFHHASLGLFQTNLMFVLISQILKYTTGAFSPDWLDRCKPTPDGICTGDAELIGMDL